MKHLSLSLCSFTEKRDREALSPVLPPQPSLRKVFFGGRTAKKPVGLSQPLHHGSSSPQLSRHATLPPSIFQRMVAHRCLPIPSMGYSEAGTEPMPRDEWHPACCCPYHLETAAGGLPGVWILVKLSVSFLTGPWDNYSGWQGPQEISTPKPDQLWGHTRLLRAWSSKPPRTEPVQPHSQGNLLHCLAVLMGERLLLTPSLTLLFQLFPSPCTTTEGPAPSRWPSCRHWGAVGSSRICLFSRMNKPSSLSLHLKQCRDAKYQQK